ncbi:hypothetical protein HZ326_7306 [Fusarium oxysporum f. sp. albedinis]|nr:hypothetical protein HZ326_7306 [Fusarium oxysporum f. sp. albedinis]
MLNKFQVFFLVFFYVLMSGHICCLVKMKLSVVISFCSSLATAYVAQGCQQDTCVKAAIGNYQYPNLDACKSFLLATAVPAPT